MSKQSNQRYRKEKEKEHLQKAGIDRSASNSIKETQNQDKFNRELAAPTDNANT